MRRFLLVTLMAAALAMMATPPAHARAFRQTYGATVATADGGCAWNMSMDFFVPRTCDSCRYDLFSACKTSHTTSPACINQHPIYCGYCTPYGACRYKWRDHVYAKHCGCTPLACTYGPWKLDKCRKHCCRRTPDVASCCGAGGCSGGCAMTPLVGCADAMCVDGACQGEAGGYGVNDCSAACGWHTGDAGYLPNVEPFGVAIIGTVEAYPARLGAAGMGGGMGMPMPAAGPAAMPGIPGVPQPTNMPAGLPSGGGFAYPNF
jgi:hypothetical protein